MQNSQCFRAFGRRTLTRVVVSLPQFLWVVGQGRLGDPNISQKKMKSESELQILPVVVTVHVPQTWKNVHNSGLQLGFSSSIIGLKKCDK